MFSLYCGGCYGSAILDQEQAWCGEEVLEGHVAYEDGERSESDAWRHPAVIWPVIAR